MNSFLSRMHNEFIVKRGLWEEGPWGQQVLDVLIADIFSDDR